jgi:hypothetical protein
LPEILPNKDRSYSGLAKDTHFQFAMRTGLFVETAFSLLLFAVKVRGMGVKEEKFSSLSLLCLLG